MANDDKRDGEGGDDAREERAKSLFGETLKKVFSAGVTAAFMTEENVRQYMQDLKLPKEILGLLLSSANKSKDEITNRVSNEVIRIISKIDWVKEFAKFAEGHKFKISAEIEVVKKHPEKS